MCIIQGDGANVSKTSILVAPLPDNRQVTIYSNRVAFEGEVKSPAMILPVPAGKIEFIDLSGYSDFFKELSKLFVRPTRAATHLFMNLDLSFNVGSYQVRVVKNFADFSNVEREGIFSLDRRVAEYLLRHYPAGYHFIICQLRPNVTDYHPFAYTHSRCSEKKLFIPTRHFHLDDGGMTHTDWDHQIYTWNCTADWNYPGQFLVNKVTSVDITNVFHLCGITATKIAYQYSVKNYHRNHDLAATASD